MTAPNDAARPAERQNEPAHVTWESLTAAAPALLSLERDIRRAAWHLQPRTGEIDQIWAGRGGFKGRLSTLVGWGAANPQLRTSEAYEIAYRHLYDLLEDAEERVNGGRR